VPTTNASRAIKGSKDADFSLISFKKQTKNSPWGLEALGQVT